MCGLRKPEGRSFRYIVHAALERLSYSFANQGKDFFLHSKRTHAGPNEGRARSLTTGDRYGSQV